MRTPEFLAWAIGFTCPLRGDLDGSDPEQVERQLRAARAVSDAERDGRVLDGLCVNPPDGFHIAESLAIYGGELACRQACGECPANALRTGFGEGLAGCYGILPLPDDPAAFHRAIDRSLNRRAESFPTTPRWYGLWLHSPLEIERLFLTWQVLDASGIQSRPLEELKLALNTAYNIGGRLHIRLYPPGRVEGQWWKLAPHCPKCRAAWQAAEGVAHSYRCTICGYAGHPAPEQKRRARGQRPYFPLDRLLGKEQAADFLVRYEAAQAQGRPPDRA